MKERKLCRIRNREPTEIVTTFVTVELLIAICLRKQRTYYGSIFIITIYFLFFQIIINKSVVLPTQVTRSRSNPELHMI